MSAMASVEPDGLPLKKSTLPSGPTGTITMFGTVWLLAKLTLEVLGTDEAVPPDVSFGYTVRKPLPVGLVTVTLTATAVIPEGIDTPPTVVPPTGSEADFCAAILPWATPVPLRVS